MGNLEYLQLPPAWPLRVSHCGLFISRGRGMHPETRIDSFELIFVQRGRLGIHEDERSFDLQAGQTLLLWPGRRHGGTLPYPEDLRFFWIHFYPPGELKSVSHPDALPNLQIPQLATLTEPERLVEIFRRYLDDQESGRLHPVSSDLLVKMMLFEVAQASQLVRPATGAAILLAQRTRTTIRTHFAQPLSTSIVASALGCNQDYLGRVFRTVYGITLTEAIHRERLRMARQLLLDGELSLAGVAESCGFEDAGYFRRLFRRYEGMSPLAYRRLYAQAHINTE